jgi:hypothetical protein
MNELHFIHKVRQHLNRGLHDLSPATLSRLDAARQRALAHQKVAAHQSVLATAGSFIHHQFDNLQMKQVLLAVLLLVSVASYTAWNADQQISEIEAIDSALLADDLPIGALTDKGFDTWLKSYSSR